jgi:hypothetical protein
VDASCAGIITVSQKNVHKSCSLDEMSVMMIDVTIAISLRQLIEDLFALAQGNE